MKIKFRADLGNKFKFIVKRRMLDITAINQDVYINNRTGNKTTYAFFMSICNDECGTWGNSIAAKTSTQF